MDFQSMMQQARGGGGGAGGGNPGDTPQVSKQAGSILSLSLSLFHY